MYISKGKLTTNERRVFINKSFGIHQRTIAIAKIAGIKMCESYNLQYGTNFISVMPTNLYGPNDNFNLETSHVLPALIRKIHLGKCLEENNWDNLSTDLNRRPIEGTDGNATEKDIKTVLKKYGLTVSQPNRLTASPLNQVSVEIWGSGKPMREFLWSEEMADACVFLMENVNFKDLIREGNGSIPPIFRPFGSSCEKKNSYQYWNR
jgi:GDP-L-fucose synthase